MPIDPTILSLGPLEIRWYGVVYVLGFLLAAWWLQKNKEELNLTKEQVWDFIFYLILGVLIGSRLFMIFWNPQVYLLRPWNLLFIWQGGMSFHGGFAGVVIAGYWYCKKNRLNFWKVADIVSIPAIFALALGRVANFINGELWGRVTTSSWGIIFENAPLVDGVNQPRHPSTLYAAAKRFAIFGYLLFLTFKKEFKPGFIFWNFVFFEGLGRIIVDFYRDNQLFLNLSLGQWFSLMMVVISLYAFNKFYKDDCRLLFKRR